MNTYNHVREREREMGNQTAHSNYPQIRLTKLHQFARNQGSGTHSKRNLRGSIKFPFPSIESMSEADFPLVGHW